MHSTYILLETMAVGFGIALLFGYLAQKLRLSVIVGYLAAGFLIGPLTPGFVADPELANNLSEAGIILLMFGVGLHFNTEDLMSVKGIAIPGAIAQSVGAATFGILVSMMDGYSLVEGVFLGLGLSVASTVVLLRVLTDAGRLNTYAGTVAVGWLVVEDIFTVLMLVLLPSIGPALAAGDSISFLTILSAIGMAIVKLILLWILVMVVGGRVVPWLLKRILRTRSHELFTLTVLSAAFLTALFAAYVFDASFALGAFLGGMVVGKSKVSHQAAAELIPLRDAFAVLFFLSVGMLFRPAFLIEQPVIIILALMIVLLVKPLIAIGIVSLLGCTAETAFTIAAGLSQIGEFSFILAQTGLGMNLISENIYSVLIACALVSIAVNPFCMKAVPHMVTLARAHPVLWHFLNHRAEKKTAEISKSTTDFMETAKEGETFAIIAGYGPTGQAVAESVTAASLSPVILEMNIDTVSALEAKGIATVYGDITKTEILKAAGIERAPYFIITVPATEPAALAAMAAKNLNPDIVIFARTRFLQDADILKDAGVDHVISEESAIVDRLAEIVAKALNGRDEKLEETTSKND